MSRRGPRRWRSATAVALWVSIAIGVVTAIAVVSLPGFIRAHQAWSWLVLVGLCVLATYLLPRENKTDGWAQLEQAPSALPTARDRARALKSVGKAVADRLNEGLGGQPHLDLTLAPVPGVLPELAQPNFERASAALPLTTVPQAYESSGSMVLLGAAGAGKSTLLLHLAEHLLKQAEQSPDEPVPVVISLAGWGRRRPSMRHLRQVLRWRLRRLIRWLLHRPPPERVPQPPAEDLVRWLIRQVDDRYGVAPGDTLAWLKNRRLVLLLDSLDECAQEARGRFVAEFARLADPRVVLCCRTPDFERLPDRPVFRAAWSVQPLTRSQVEQVLAAELKNALHEDDDLWQLLSAPIWLRIIRHLNYWPERVRDHSISVGDRGRELLDAFLLEVFSKRAPAGVSTGQMLRWVVQLARLAGAADDPESVDLRAPTRGARLSPLALFPVVVRAVPALLVAPFALGFVLPFAWIYGLAGTGHAIGQGFAYVGIPVFAFVAAGLVPGYDRASVPSRRKRRRLAYGAVLAGAGLGMLGFGLVVGLHALAVTSMDTVRWVLVAGFAVPAAVLFRLSRNPELRIVTAGLAALGIASLFVTAMTPDEFTYAVAGVLQGILLTLPLLVVSAARGSSPEGFWLTPAMLIMVPLSTGFGLIACLVPWTGMWLSHDRNAVGKPLTSGMVEGWVLAAVCLIGLVYLMRAEFTTWTGRLLLALEGRLPWRLRPLLVSAESSGLFIRAGAGYRFAHPLMQRHLAEMDVLDIRPLTEPDPELRDQALALVGQVITRRRAAAEPPVRFPVLLSDGSDVRELAGKLASPETRGQLEVINGAPGSGRSTLLLDLASELVSHPAAPVPLILVTSVWSSAAIHADGSQPAESQELGQRTFTRLLLRAVDQEYGLQPHDMRQLLFQGKVILFLDDACLTLPQTLRFLHLAASFLQAYPAVSLVLTADLAVLPMAVRDDSFGPKFLNGANTTRITPLDRDTLLGTVYADYVQPLADTGFLSQFPPGPITTFSQLHRLVEAAQAAREGHGPLADIYVTNALALGPGEQRLRSAMQKIAWLSRPYARSAGPPWLGIRSLRLPLAVPRPIARAQARCATPLARGLVLAIGGAYAIAGRFGTPTALAGSAVLILLDLAWQGWPGRAGLGGAISQRCAARRWSWGSCWACHWAGQLSNSATRLPTS